MNNPMKTRDRILECALLLFNQRGESNISTLEIATELDMSPGNLYYHFHGKEPLIMELFARFKNELAPLLNPPEQLEVEPEDYALFIHLVVERMAAYRFFFQDLANLSVRLPQLARQIRQWLNQFKHALATLLTHLQAQGVLVSDSQMLGLLVEQVTLTLLFSLDYQRVMGMEPEVRVVVFNVLMLATPHLHHSLKPAVEKIALRYLSP